MSASPLVQKLAQAILELIESGTLATGAHLGTPKLAARFDVSRSPVREALEDLAHRGILAREPNRGFFVADRHAASQEDVSPTASDEPPGYYEITEDWLQDKIPSEVTEQFLRERYGLSSVQLGKVLTLGMAEGWIERKGGYGWRPSGREDPGRAGADLIGSGSIEPAALLEPTFALDWRSLETNRAAQNRLLDGAIDTLSPAALISAGAHFHEDVVRMSGNHFFFQTLVRLNRVRRLIEFRSMVNRKRLYRQCREHLELIGLSRRPERRCVAFPAHAPQPCACREVGHPPRQAGAHRHLIRFWRDWFGNPVIPGPSAARSLTRRAAPKAWENP